MIVEKERLKRKNDMGDILKRKKIRINGQTIFYLDSQQNRKHYPILFLHGWAFSTLPFIDTLKRISLLGRVIAPDLPGFGHSYSRKCWDYNTYSSIIFSFIKKLGLRKINLLGFSMGGGISIHFVDKHPQYVNKLILVESSGVPHLIRKIALSRFLETPLQFINSGFHFNNLKMLYSYIHTIILYLKNLYYTMDVILKESLLDKANKINIPTLLLWGKKDLLFNVKNAYILSKNIKNCKLFIVDNAYHEWIIFYSDILHDYVKDFLIA